MKFLYTGRYTSSGVKGVLEEGGDARSAATRAVFEAVGGRILEYAFCFGEHDFVILADLPDEAAAAIPPMMARASGTVEVTALRLYGPEELASADRARGVGFRAAGH